MNLGITLKKAGLGALTFISASILPMLVAWLTANQQLVVDKVQILVGAAVTAAIVGLTNWLKNRTKTS